MLSIIAVIGKNREIGKNNGLIWNLPGDLTRFRRITKGHPVIMGRRTFESIGHPLPDRTNILITHDTSFTAVGVTIVHSLDEAVKVGNSSPGAGEIFVIGGGQIYAAAIHRADRLYLTVVDEAAPIADTFFPVYSDRFTKVVENNPQEENGIHYAFLTLEAEE